MKITQETDYAFRILLFLGRLGVGHKVDAKTISETEGVTLRFTLKILRKLAIGKLVVSFRGVNGGYALDMDPKTITMREVIEAVEGPIFFNKCLYDEANCNLGRSTTCQLNKAFSGIQARIVDELEKTTLENILKF